MLAQLLLSLQHWRLIAAQGQNFDAFSGNGNGMLKLPRELPVFGYNCPSVTLDRDHTATCVDHRLDCEDHALAQLYTGSPFSEVEHLRFLMHLSAYAMPAIFPHNRAAVFLGVPFYREADIPQMGSRPHLPYALPHRLLGDPHQPSRSRRGIADQIGLA